MFPKRWTWQSAEYKAMTLGEKGLWGRYAEVYLELLGAVEVARIAKRLNDCLREAGRT